MPLSSSRRLAVYIKMIEQNGWSWLEVEHSTVDGGNVQPKLSSDRPTFREKVKESGPLFGVTIELHDWRRSWRDEYTVQPPVPRENLQDFAAHMIALAADDLIDPDEKVIFRYSRGIGTPSGIVATSEAAATPST